MPRLGVRASEMLERAVRAASSEVLATNAEYCTDCKTTHGQFLETFSEWSWHAPWWKEIAQTLPELGAVRAAGLAWRYQQRRIDTLRERLARYEQMEAGHACD